MDRLNGAIHVGQNKHDTIRLRYLDGLRGVAITAVMLWHFFGPAEAKILPYGARYAAYPVLSAGWMGVELFFLISGFVIFMTIEKCSGLGDFMSRRLQRLFPAMLVATVLLLGIDKLGGMPGPHGAANFVDTIPGLSFISPAIWHVILRFPVKSLSGSFWTLYVEMAFYLTFAVLYFRFGWRVAVAGLVLLFLGVTFGDKLSTFPHLGWLSRLISPLQWCGVQYFGWFASGALFYKAANLKDRRTFVCAVAVGILSAILFGGSIPIAISERLELGAVVALFACAQTSAALQRTLSTGPVVFMGAISYPLYLVHSNIGIPLIIRAAPAISPLPPELGTALSIFAVVTIGWLITRFAEPWTKRRLKPLTKSARSFAQLVFA